MEVPNLSHYCHGHDECNASHRLHRFHYRSETPCRDEFLNLPGEPVDPRPCDGGGIDIILKDNLLCWVEFRDGVEVTDATEISAA